MILSASNLRRAATIQEKIEDLQQELASLLSGGGKVAKSGKPGRPSKSAASDEAGADKPAKRKSGISAAGRKRIAAAQKARWAKSKAEAETTEKKAK